MIKLRSIDDVPILALTFHGPGYDHADLRRVAAEVQTRIKARITVAEVPPGPPVLQTLVAECFAPTEEARLALAAEAKRIFENTPGVVDVDGYVPDAQRRVRIVVDKEKAALHGISAETVAATIQLSAEGMKVGLLHESASREDINILLQLPRSSRTRPEDLLGHQPCGDSAGGLDGESGFVAQDSIIIHLAMEGETHTI